VEQFKAFAGAEILLAKTAREPDSRCGLPLGAHDAAALLGFLDLSMHGGVQSALLSEPCEEIPARITANHKHQPQPRQCQQLHLRCQHLRPQRTSASDSANSHRCFAVGAQTGHNGDIAPPAPLPEEQEHEQGEEDQEGEKQGEQQQQQQQQQHQKQQDRGW
jgi:hypothetical protein